MTQKYRLYFRSKPVLIVSAIAVIVVGVLIIVGYVPFRSAVIKKYITQQINKTGIDSCSISDTEVKVWNYILLNNIYLHTDNIFQEKLVIKVEKMSVPGNFFTFFGLRNRLKKAFKHNASNTSKDNTISSNSFTNIFIKNGATILGDIPITFTGVQVSQTVKEVQLFSTASGNALLFRDSSRTDSLILQTSFPMLTIAKEQLKQCSCTVSLSSHAVLSVQQFKCKYYKGTINFNGTANLTTMQLPAYTFTIENMEIGTWYAIHKGIGVIDGNVSLHFEGKKTPLVYQIPNGVLTCTISNVSLDSLPIQKSLVNALFIPTMSSLKFDSISTIAHIDETDTITTEFHGSGGQLDFNAHGWVTRNGYFEQKLTGVFSRSMAATFPPFVKKSLKKTKNRGREFTCRLYGTNADPRFELDKEILQRAVGTLFEDFSEDIIKMYIP